MTLSCDVQTGKHDLIAIVDCNYAVADKHSQCEDLFVTDLAKKPVGLLMVSMMVMQKVLM